MELLGTLMPTALSSAANKFNDTTQLQIWPRSVSIVEGEDVGVCVEDVRVHIVQAGQHLQYI